jgi:hypothetical protein
MLRCLALPVLEMQTVAKISLQDESRSNSRGHALGAAAEELGPRGLSPPPKLQSIKASPALCPSLFSRLRSFA